MHTPDVNIDKAKAMLDVNFWGMLACIQAFAPS
jgi:NADP-dependent 3-hydroxy acid dehydrogenase YdfG